MNTVELKDYVLVKVPEDGEDFVIKNNDLGCYVEFETVNDTDTGTYDCIDLPKGNYQIVGLAKDLTEDQWKEIVEKILDEGVNGYDNGLWRNYEIPDEIKFAHNKFWQTATNSGHSLVKHHGLELNNCLVLKKVL